MNDENERSVASAGSVACEPVAWAAFVNGVLDLAFKSQADAFMWAYKRNGIEIVPLYRQPQYGVVRLPSLDPNAAPGWNAAIGAVREALADAGVDWDTE